MRIEKVMFGYVIALALAIVGVLVLSGTVQASEVAVQPTLQASLATIIQQVQSTVSNGVDFLKQEVPDVIKQLLVWKAVLSAVWAGVHTFLFIVGVVALRNAIKVIYEQSRLESVEAAAQEVLSETRGEERQALKVKYALAQTESAAHMCKVVIGCVLGVIFTIAGIAAFCNIWGHFLTVVQIYIAPKVWLIEYAASLVK